MIRVVKRTPKSEDQATNYPKMAVVGNLPRNVNILETFDNNTFFQGYPNSNFSFDFILVFINQLGK